WIGTHGKIGGKLPALKGYYQNHVSNSEQLGINYKRGLNKIDGISQLWFEDLESMQNSFQSDIGQELKSDEKNFIESVDVVTAKQNTVIPVHEGKVIKRMSILKRNPEIDIKTFQHEWEGQHAELIKRMPYVKGYKQNVIFNDNLQKSTSSINYNKNKIDGIVELWFENIEQLKSAFASSEGKKAMSHSETFIKEITTY